MPYPELWANSDPEAGRGHDGFSGLILADCLAQLGEVQSKAVKALIEAMLIIAPVQL